jgi:uncharacterized protein (TIGR03435 family)
MATLALAQAPDSKNRAEFDVASIRRATNDFNQDSRFDGGLYSAHNLSLKRLIANAYEIDIRQIYGGPNWADSESYDITAKAPGGVTRARDTLPPMIQSLLADRFHLVIHRERRQISGLELVVTNKGVKMERARPDQVGSNTHSNNTHLKAENVTMERFAAHLSRDRDVGQLVVDKTGLSGGFNFELDWMPEPHDSNQGASSDDRGSIFTALLEQLGLKLESAKVPILAIVIDRVERPSEN